MKPLSYLPTVLVFCGVFSVLLATSEMLPLTWDEGESIDRAEKILDSFRSEAPFSRESVQKHWVFTTQVEGHPAGYGVVIASGYRFASCFPHLFSPKTEYRFGPIVLFSLAMGAVFFRLEKLFSRQVGLFAVGIILLLPRVFAHAHIAACDSSLTACWLLAWATFDGAFADEQRSRIARIRGIVLWGVCLGLTLSMKWTGWAALAPFLLSVLLVRNSRGKQSFADRHSSWVSNLKSYFNARFFLLLYRFLPGLLVALGVFFLLNPPLWFEPVRGFCKFVSLNTSREGFNISILFWGRMYNLDHPLPWYNTIVWTLITIPSGFLLLGLLGLWSGKYSRAMFVILLHGTVLLIVRAIPGTPPHDGVRLFVTAFPFLAMIAALGAAACWSARCGRRFWAGKIVVVLIFAVGVFNLGWYAPQWLSYYNALIGGLGGASRAGFEPTYYWDSLDREVLDWIDEHTAEDELVLFSASSKKTLLLMRQWGELRTDFYRKSATDQQGKRIRWYVLQRRPSGEYPRDLRLIENATPVFVKTVRKGGLGPWRLDQTPILEIYDFEDWQAND